MKPSLVFLSFAVAFCLFNCNADDDVSDFGSLVELSSVSEITSNSVNVTLKIIKPVVHQNDSTFLINGENIGRVGFAYTTDPALPPWRWDSVMTKPIIAPVISINIPNLQSDTRYHVKAMVLYRVSAEEQKLKQQFNQFQFTQETLQFQTN